MGRHIHTRQWWGAYLTKHRMEKSLSKDLKEILIVDDIEIIPSIVPYLTVGATLNKCC
jgi:hypothetical protein